MKRDVNTVMNYDIYHYRRNGQRQRINWPTFLSSTDAVKALAMIQALPLDVERATVEDVQGQWVAEVTRKEPST